MTSAFALDNIVFVLNVLDSLSGDERFVEIRKRRPAHRTLTAIEDVERSYKDDLVKNEKDTDASFNWRRRRSKREKRRQPSRKRNLRRKRLSCKQNWTRRRKGRRPVSRAAQAGPRTGSQIQEALINHFVEQQRVATEVAQIDRDSQSQESKLQREFNTNIRGEQNFYKFLALLVPPIPPFLVAAFVYFRRRAEEREGVAKSRLR